MESITLQPVTRVDGEVQIPGSKSLSNRILLLAALAEGGITVARLSIAIAIVGIIVASMSSTGIPTKFAVLLSGASEYSLLAALLITAIGCIVLGMGMPTLPAYIAIIVVMGFYKR